MDTPGGPPRSQPSLSWSLGAAIAVAVACVFAATRQPLQVAIAIVIFLGLFAAWAISSERRRWGPIGVCSPLAIYGVSWLVYFGIFGLGAFGSTVYPVHILPEEIVAAMVTALGCLVLIAVGYRLATLGMSPTPRRLIGDATQPINSLSAVHLCLVVGWAARLYRFENGTFGYSGIGQDVGGLGYRIVQLADGLLIVGLALLALAAWSQYPHRSISQLGAKRLLLVNVLPLLVITGLASGVKGQLITDLLPVGLLYLMLKRKVPWAPVIGVVVYLVVLYGGVQSFREDLSAGRLQESESVGLVGRTGAIASRIVDSWSGTDPREQFGQVWDEVTLEYAATPSNLALVLQLTPDFIPHIGVSRLFKAPVFFVPTNVLADPYSNIGRYFAVTYLRTTPNTSVYPTQPGDFYMSGGWSALVIGELIVGLLLGFVWRFVMMRKLSNRSAVVYVVIAANFASAGLDWGNLSRSVFQYIVFYGLAMHFLMRESKREPLEHPQLAGPRRAIGKP